MRTGRDINSLGPFVFAATGSMQRRCQPHRLSVSIHARSRRPMNSRACSSVIVRLGGPPPIRACRTDATDIGPIGRTRERPDFLLGREPRLVQRDRLHRVADDLVHLVQLDPPPVGRGQDCQCLATSGRAVNSAYAMPGGSGCGFTLPPGPVTIPTACARTRTSAAPTPTTVCRFSPS